MRTTKLHLNLILLFTWSLLSVYSFAQDTIVLSIQSDALNHSITDQFVLYESRTINTVKEFNQSKKKLEGRKLIRSIENLDFTSSNFYIDFVLVNQDDSDLELVLETARPITNTVALYNLNANLLAQSGDAIDFSQKTISSNRSLLPLKIKANSSQRYILKLSSDGEIISLPMIFWESHRIDHQERVEQFLFGIFYGIFIFVIIIYFTFYLLLKDPLFLLYTIYVFFSGMLQFVLDGYGHMYLFPSGGYFTQHQVIFVAGLTVFFALLYAIRYLELKGRLRKITYAIVFFVLVTNLLSLIPGKLYELGYPLINGFSFLAVLFLFIIAIRIRRINPKISILFLVGLFTLMFGAFIFILGNFSVIDIPIITQNSLKVGTLVEIICLSILMAGKYKELQDDKEQIQRQLVLELEEKNTLISETNIRLEKEVQERTKEIEKQRSELKEKNDDFVASIKYAERIQKALLSNTQRFKSVFKDSFVIYYPKDIVSGDFYWIDRIEPSDQNPNGLIVYATADCTGHGVPGAFVSIICDNLLKSGKRQESVNSTGEALDFANTEINRILNNEYSDENIRDGMDVALCAIDPITLQLQFSGAKHNLYIVRNGEMIELKGDRKAIGYIETEDHPFTTHTYQLQKGDMLYSFSDGFPDQFGGPDGKKFTTKRLKSILETISNESISHQESTLENYFDLWKDEAEQVDDVLLVGIRI